MRLFHEDIRDSLVQAGQKACGYMNCKLFVQTVTGIPKLDDLPSRSFRSVSDLTAGDVLKWGTGQHWAIYIGDGDIMEVEEWGATSRTVPLAEVLEEMDPPDMVFSTDVPQQEGLLREYIRGLLVEQDEEEQTIEQKLKQLFFSPGASAVQAYELAISYGDVDPEFMKLMEDVFEIAHNSITSYLYYAEAYAAGDFHHENDERSGFGTDLTIKGDGREQRKYFADEEAADLRKALEVLANYGEKIRDYKRVVDMFGNFGKLRVLTIYPDDIKGEPKEEQAYKDAVAWAGEPR